MGWVTVVSGMDRLASWMRTERSEDEDKRTTEEGKNLRERTVERCGVQTRRLKVGALVESREVGQMRIEPSLWPVAYSLPSGETSKAVIFFAWV